MAEGILHEVESRGIHRLILDRGPNALDRPMMESLHEAVSELRRDHAPPVVLASAHPALFCPGWNLKLLADAGREEVAQFLTTFNNLVLELFSYPGPTAAEVGGHAVAGGCLLATCCDLRVMAQGRPRLGLSELNLGVPVPTASLLMLRARLGQTALDELVFRGEGCAAERARDLGIVHRAVADRDLGPTTMLELGRLAGRPRQAFSETKRALYGEWWERMRELTAREDEAFLDCWFEAETRDRIAEVASRLGG